MHWFRTLKPAIRTLIAAGGVIAAGLAWWLGSPLILDRAVDETFPTVAAAPTDRTDRVLDPMEPSSRTERQNQQDGGTSSPTTAPGAPVALAEARFAGADDFHQGRGTATVYELEDGSLVLRLTDFEVTNGPDLRVTLFDGSEYLDLGALKGNIGDQNYQIPAGTDLADYSSVVIWCRAFDVVFATASL